MASTPVVVMPFTLAQALVPLRKSSRSAGSPVPPSTSSSAAARLSNRVVALVMESCVP
ncbi:hypothetical protein D9M70_200260 [compost metagenome]